jgi:hypothetical protein
MDDFDCGSLIADAALVCSLFRLDGDGTGWAPWLPEDGANISPRFRQVVDIFTDGCGAVLSISLQQSSAHLILLPPDGSIQYSQIGPNVMALILPPTTLIPADIEFDVSRIAVQFQTSDDFSRFVVCLEAFARQAGAEPEPNPLDQLRRMSSSATPAPEAHPRPSTAPHEHDSYPDSAPAVPLGHHESRSPVTSALEALSLHTHTDPEPTAEPISPLPASQHPYAADRAPSASHSQLLSVYGRPVTAAQPSRPPTSRHDLRPATPSSRMQPPAAPMPPSPRFRNTATESRLTSDQPAATAPLAANANRPCSRLDDHVDVDVAPQPPFDRSESTHQPSLTQSGPHRSRRDHFSATHPHPADATPGIPPELNALHPNEARRFLADLDAHLEARRSYHAHLESRIAASLRYLERGNPLAGAAALRDEYARQLRQYRRDRASYLRRVIAARRFEASQARLPPSRRSAEGAEWAMKHSDYMQWRETITAVEAFSTALRQRGLPVSASDATGAPLLAQQAPQGACSAYLAACRPVEMAEALHKEREEAEGKLVAALSAKWKGFPPGTSASSALPSAFAAPVIPARSSAGSSGLAASKSSRSLSSAHCEVSPASPSHSRVPSSVWEARSPPEPPTHPAQTGAATATETTEAPDDADPLLTELAAQQSQWALDLARREANMLSETTYAEYSSSHERP